MTQQGESGFRALDPHSSGQTAIHELRSLISRLEREYGIEPVTTAFDHMFREPGSDATEEYVALQTGVGILKKRYGQEAILNALAELQLERRREPPPAPEDDHMYK